MNTFSKRISLYLYRKGKICYNEIDEIRFAIEIVLAQIATFLPMLIIGLFLSKIIETILFLFVFILLRINSDGYHYPLFYQCLLVTNCIYFVCVFIAPSYINYTSAVKILLIALIINILRCLLEPTSKKKVSNIYFYC